MPRTNDNWVFSRGVAVSAQRVFFMSFPDIGDDEPKDVTQIVCWSPDRVGSFMLPWEAKAISYLEYPESHGIIMGPFGRVRVSAPRGSADESIATGDGKGPTELGVLRDLRAIGQHVYAVGMNRQCYRRQSGANSLVEALWQRIDQGVLNEGPPDPVTGFNSIDGFAEDNIYAVGWHGEIWRYNGRHWEQTQSGTNLKLERVVCTPQGTVFAVGQSGVIIRGAGELWTQVEQHETQEQFWGAIWYRDRLWLATHTGVYTLDDYDNLEPVRFPMEESATCGWLMAADGILWSVGTHHVLYSSDGKEWTQLFL